MFGFSPPIQKFFAGFGFLAFFSIGCSSKEYPESLRYPERSDLLVIKKPSTEPFYPHPPGDLTQSIAAIEGKDGGETKDPKAVDSTLRTELNEALIKVFGTPAKPSVLADDADKLDLDDETLAAGSILYRRHCLHCHGLAGDGRGPTGPWVNPHPRDYRQGKFKFLSTDNSVAGRKPRRADIIRVISTGIEGTSMPAFSLLQEGPLNQLASYVIHLSIRGEVEFETLKTLLTTGPSALEGQSVDKNVAFLANLLVTDQWVPATTSKPITPEAYPYKDQDKEASIIRGYKLFTNPEGAASCISCHKDFGRQVNFRYDIWGTLVRPANLANPTYRGGRRPIDLFWRINGGIDPSGMPSASSLSQKDTWDLVNFVQAMPYPRMLPEQIRDKIYVPTNPPKKNEHASR
jgi:mono/diheme cytochrome c family protein